MRGFSSAAQRALYLAFTDHQAEEETFEVYELPSPSAYVRQILGRPGEVWGAESGVDKLVVIRAGCPE